MTFEKFKLAQRPFLTLYQCCSRFVLLGIGSTCIDVHAYCSPFSTLFKKNKGNRHTYVDTYQANTQKYKSWTALFYIVSYILHRSFSITSRVHSCMTRNGPIEFCLGHEINSLFLLSWFAPYHSFRRYIQPRGREIRS